MTIETSAVVIGAGPAGLSAAGALTAAGVSHLVLERSHRVAPSWANHYERLHLHTVKRHSSLPYLPFPDSVPQYPSREGVVSYLEGYARHFKIAPRFETEVRRARREADHWVVETSGGTFRSRFLIVAAGYNAVPRKPPFEGMADFRGPLVHTSEYRNARPYKDQRVLVVGCGNSGAEIALDLAEQGAKPWMVVRGPVHVLPRDVLGTPSQVSGLMMSRLPPKLADKISVALMRVVVGDLSRWGIVRPEIGPIAQIRETGRVPMLDIGTIARVKSGEIQVVPAVKRFTSTGAVFADGRELPFDAVILATGYDTNIDHFLEGSGSLLDAHRRPVDHGRESKLPGLYFIGYRNPPTGALREIGLEGPRIAEDIRRKQASA